MEHIQCKNLGLKVRNLALELNNTHGETDLAHLITLNLMDVFQEVTSISDLSKKDSEALKNSRETDKIISKVLGYINAANKNSKENPNKTLIFSETLVSLCNPLLEDIKENNSDDFYCFISDRVALCLNGLAVSYGNRTKRFKESISILKKALNFAAETDTFELIEDNVAIYSKNLGLTLYGDSRLNDFYSKSNESISKIGDFFKAVFFLFFLIIVVALIGELLGVFWVLLIMFLIYIICSVKDFLS